MERSVLSSKDGFYVYLPKPWLTQLSAVYKRYEDANNDSLQKLIDYLVSIKDVASAICKELGGLDG